MKVIFLLLSTVIICVFGLYIAVASPIHFYQTYVENGISSKFLFQSRPRPRLLSLEKIDLELPKVSSSSQKLWKKVKIGDYLLSLPSFHPSVHIVPMPSLYGKKSVAGFDLYGADDKSLFSLSPYSSVKLNLSTPPDMLFRMALVKNMIKKKGRRKIWNDIFNKDLVLPEISVFNPLSVYNMYKNYSPLDIAYNIYIYKMRKRIFPAKFKSLYMAKNNHVLFSIVDEQNNYHSFHGYYVHQGRIYKYKVKYEKYKLMAKLLMKRFLDNLEVELSKGEEDTLSIYGKFRTLKYRDQLSIDGTMYLYACWSHAVDDSNYIRELVRYAEKGNNNEKYLFGVYKYALERWGTTFSTKQKYLQETVQRHIDRKAELERSQEEKDLESIDNSTTEFSSEEERIKYFLNRSKRNKVEKKKNVIIEN